MRLRQPRLFPLKLRLGQMEGRFGVGDGLFELGAIELRHDLAAGLFAPVELLLADEGTGSSLTYVKPSSLMVVEPNSELLSAAEQLDAKLAALAEKAISGS